MSLKERAKKIQKAIPAVFLALKDKETPPAAKILAAVTVAYALSPVDLIPDFIPVLGLVDDLIILPALTALTVRLIPRNVWERSLERSGSLWPDGRPKKWYYAIPAAVIWLVIIGAVLLIIF